MGGVKTKIGCTEREREKRSGDREEWRKDGGRKKRERKR